MENVRFGLKTFKFFEVVTLSICHFCNKTQGFINIFKFQKHKNLKDIGQNLGIYNEMVDFET